MSRLTVSGRLEQYSTARNPLGFYYNVAVAATYTLPESSLSIEDYVYRTCESAIRQHPILSAIPIGEDTKEPYWARLPEIDLEGSVSFQKRSHPFPGEDEKDDELEKLLNIQHNTAFSLPLPYWRVCVLLDAENEHRFTAVFVFHHAVGDGTSGKAFHRSFLDGLYAATEPSAETRRVIASPTMPLLPSIEEIHPMTLTIPYLATTLFKEKVWSWRDPGLWTGSEIRVPLETQMRHIVIPKSLATSFRHTCRRHNSTITGALQTIVSRAFFTHLPETFTQLKCNGPLSSRKFLPDIVTDDSIGVWIQDYDEYYSRDGVMVDSFPWSEAQRSRRAIESTLSLQGTNASPNLLKYVNDFHQELFLSKVGKQRGSSFELSNIGVFVPGRKLNDDSSKPHIGRMIFSQCASVTGCAVEISVISGGDGCLVLAFSWQTGVVKERLVSSVIETVKKEVHELAQ